MLYEEELKWIATGSTSDTRGNGYVNAVLPNLVAQCDALPVKIPVSPCST